MEWREGWMYRRKGIYRGRHSDGERWMESGEGEEGMDREE